MSAVLSYLAAEAWNHTRYREIYDFQIGDCESCRLL